MKIIVNSIIPFKGYKYINLFGFLFTRKNTNVKISKSELNHESIHTLQMKWLLWIFFYILYFIEWLCKIIPSLFCNIGKYNVLHYAYRSISFEQVAIYNQDNLNYLDTANPYEWIKYIFRMYKI